MNYKKVYKEAIDSVVLIDSYRQKGAGFIVRDDSLILTNHHVVHPTDNVLVEYQNGESCVGLVVCSNRSIDLACVYPVDEKIRQRRPLLLGVSFVAEVGDPIIGIGHPLQDSSFTMFQGNIATTKKGLLHLNMPANHGMSGGPVICEGGEVIGVITSMICNHHGKVEGITDAVPVDTIISFLQAVPTISEKIILENQYCTVCGAFVKRDKYCSCCGVEF